MKVAVYSLAVGAVVMSATALAVPTLYKRVVDGSRVFGCFTKAFTTANWGADCNTAAATDFGLIQGLSLGVVTVDFTGSDPTTYELSSTSIGIKLMAVKGISWLLKESAQHISVVENGIPITTFDTPLSPITANDGMLTIPMPKTLIKITPGQEGLFTKGFLSALITKAEHTFTLRGAIDATFNTYGASFIPESFKVTGLGFESPVTVKGCANFPNIPFLEQTSFTFDATTGFYILTALVNIINPSQLDLTLGDVTYQIFDKDVVVGTSLYKDVHLKIGDNPFTMIATITSKKVYDALITEGYVLTFKGFDGSSKNPILTEAMRSVDFNVAFPKLSPAT